MTRLSIAYAHPASRDALLTLFMLDQQLERVALQPGDPALAAIKLQFWIDAVSAQSAAGIPLLIAVEQHWPGAALAPLAEAWGDHLEQAGDDAAVIRLTRERGALVFGQAAGVLGVTTDQAVRDAGAGWALECLKLAPDTARSLLKHGLGLRWPRRLLPLRLMSRLAADALDHPDEAPEGRRRIAKLWWWAITNH